MFSYLFSMFLIWTVVFSMLHVVIDAISFNFTRPFNTNFITNLRSFKNILEKR